MEYRVEMTGGIRRVSLMAKGSGVEWWNTATVRVCWLGRVAALCESEWEDLEAGQ